MQDAANYRLDDQKGITPVDDIETVMRVAHQISDDHIVQSGSPGTCVALQAKLPGSSVTIFDAVWDSYVEVADRLIFPHLEGAVLQADPPRSPLDEAGISRMLKLRNAAYIMPRTPEELPGCDIVYVP